MKYKHIMHNILTAGYAGSYLYAIAKAHLLTSCKLQIVSTRSTLPWNVFSRGQVISSQNPSTQDTPSISEELKLEFKRVAIFHCGE